MPNHFYFWNQEIKGQRTRYAALHVSLNGAALWPESETLEISGLCDSQGPLQSMG